MYITEHFKEIKMPKQHRDGAADSKLAKREKEKEERSRKPCRKGGVSIPSLSGDVLYWEFKAG